MSIGLIIDVLWYVFFAYFQSETLCISAELGTPHYFRVTTSLKRLSDYTGQTVPLENWKNRRGWPSQVLEREIEQFDGKCSPKHNFPGDADKMTRSQLWAFYGI